MECRKKAIKVMNAHDCITMLVPENDAILMRADILRKAGMFDEVIREYSDIKTGEFIIDKCLAFEVELAKKKDSERYYVDTKKQIRILPVPTKVVSKFRDKDVAKDESSGETKA